MCAYPTTATTSLSLPLLKKGGDEILVTVYTWMLEGYNFRVQPPCSAVECCHKGKVTAATVF